MRKTPILTPVLYIHVCTRAHTHMNIYIHLPMHTCKKITNIGQTPGSYDRVVGMCQGRRCLGRGRDRTG